jgi:hypothetical protein
MKVEVSSQLMQHCQASPCGLTSAASCDEPATVVLGLPASLGRTDEKIRSLLLEHAQLRLENALLLSASGLAAQPRAVPGQGQVRAPSPVSDAKRGCDSESTASGDASIDLSSDEAEPTTIIVKKMPKAFTSSMLVELLNAAGFKGRYDFLYAPVNFEKMTGTGCAFINFTSTEDGARFMTQFQGFCDWGVPCNGAKKAEVSWSSACQGKQTHVDRYRDSPVMHPSVPESCKPMLFDSHGNRDAFPPPQKPLYAPRMRGVRNAVEQ